MISRRCICIVYPYRTDGVVVTITKCLNQVMESDSPGTERAFLETDGKGN
jgi:hypothetical protein